MTVARRCKQENEERARTAESELKRTKEELTDKIRQLKERATSQMHKIQRSTQDAIDSYVDKFQQQAENSISVSIDVLSFCLGGGKAE